MKKSSLGAGSGALLLAVLGILALPRWAGDPSLAKSKTDERLEVLEAEQARLGRAVGEHDARLIHMEELRDEVQAAVGRVLPASARWIRLEPGASEQWDFNAAGRVQVKFLEWSGADPLFQVHSRAGDLKVSLRPGVSLVAKDDRGTEIRTYATTLHQLRVDREGRPSEALLSVEVDQKGG